MTFLTLKQAELLAFIKQYQEYRHCTPSFEEMKEGLGLKSKSGVQRLIEAMVERGYIRRLHNRARCMEVVQQPELRENSCVTLWRALDTVPTADLLTEIRRRGFEMERRA